MSPTISKQQIDRVRDANDIVEVVSSYLPLKRAGSGFKALCPFHKEKTPSFHVNPARQIFHCFGCGKGGDVIRFVMEYENVDFPTALRMLAQRAGILLKWEETGEKETVDKEALYRVLEEAATLFRTILLRSPEAQAARDYLARRGLDRKALDEFLFGYALPPPKDRMIQWAKKKKISTSLLEGAGLVVRTENGDYVDRFTDRIMIPIRDEIGRIVGFTGRTMQDDPNIPKYVNTPETPVFKKGRILFALDRAKKAILENRTAILCEGQIDTIRCHLNGFLNVVAAQGTALTEDHARILKRFADSVIIVMDPDPAGEKAAIRSAEVLLNVGLSVQVAALPKGEDPDSLIRTKGSSAFQEVLERRASLMSFAVSLLKRELDFRKEADFVRATNSILDLVTRVPTAVLQKRMLEEAAQLLAIPVWHLERDLRQRRIRTPSEIPSSADTQKLSHPPAELALCELLYHYPKVAPLVRHYLRPAYWSDPACLWVAEKLLAWHEHPEEELVKQLDEADEDARRLATRIMSCPQKVYGDEYTPEMAAQDLICRIFAKYLERRKRFLREAMNSSPAEERQRYRFEATIIAVDLEKIRSGWSQAAQVLESYARAVDASS